MSACSDRALARFQYQSMEGISTALGIASGVLSIGRFIPHPAAQAAAGVGVAAGVGSSAALWASRQYRDTYDSLEAACQQEQGPDPHQPLFPLPTGGMSFGAAAGSGGYTPRPEWVWQPGSVSDDGQGGVVVESGKWVVVWKPIIFDLTGDGFDFRSLANPVVADANHDGNQSARAWLGAGDGLLIYDYNQNGVGETAEWALTSFVSGAANDLEALRAFDSSNDGAFSAQDAEFSKFKIGIDANQDGYLSQGELHSLAEFGIEFMPLTEGFDVIDQGGAQWAYGVTVDYTGNAITNGTNGSYMMRYASVGFADVGTQTTLLQDATATIVSQDGVKSVFWTSSAALSVSLDTFTYGGESDFDTIFAGTGNDVITGNANANTLYGGAGTDQLMGGDGNDVLIADAYDLVYGVVDGGIGFDTLVLDGPAAGTVYAASHSVDAILGSESNDTLSGSGADWVYLFGGGGNDILVGSSHEDILAGGAGTDDLSGGDGNDVYLLDYGFGTDIVNDSAGDQDVVRVDRSIYSVMSYEASGYDQVVGFADGSQIILKNGRISGQGVESLEFYDFTMSRDDINVFIDLMSGFSGSSYSNHNQFSMYTELPMTNLP